ncbi:hypothetical protein V6N13_135498 [Hibiscus sabdariffa]
MHVVGPNTNNTTDNSIKDTCEQRNPDKIYGLWMQAPSRRRRPITARQGGNSIRTSTEKQQSGSRCVALSDDAVGAMLREQDGPVGSILNQVAGGMASGILNANHGSALAPEHSVKVASKDRIVPGTTTLNKEYHNVFCFENTDDVHSKTRRFNHAKQVGSTISSSKGGAKGQEDDGAKVLGDASEAVVQWSDEVTYDSQIRDDMLA